MSKSNYDIAHGFFYNNGGYYMPNYKSIGYSDNLFFSYYTVIGQLEKDKNGDKVLLLSYNNMSVSTARHIAYLRSASPFPVFRVPFEYGEHYRQSPATLAERCLENLQYYAKSKLSLKANRDEFFNYYNMLTRLNGAFKTGVKITPALKQLYNTLNDSEGVKKIKAKQAELERKEAERARRAFNKLTKNRSIADLARLAYDWGSEADSEQRAKIKEALNPNGDLAYIWRDAESGDFKTSKDVTMRAAEGLAALRLWRAGRLKHGMQVGSYTVLEVTADFVRIGCHKIPVSNLNELEG